MLKIRKQMMVQASELNGYSYNGTPFTSSDEIKHVGVVSPGWNVPEKGVVISHPKVTEIKEEV